MSTNKKRRLPRAHRPPSTPAALVTSAASAVNLPPALPSMFWQPLYLDGQQPYWVGHIPFAFWIIDAMKPSVLVELGTHTGNSYFAFCQAVERLATGTRCYAVDTWKGDAHTGEYGEDIFKRVNAHNSANYAAFSSLVRLSFDDALNFFGDDSIDLLHIDGCHEFDAVRHDFETWLPKLSNQSVVLLHDTNVRQPHFGVARFMDLLKEDYPTFQFHHSHGLGVVGVGGDISPLMLQLFESSRCEEASTGLGRIFSRLGQACLDRAEKDRLSTDLSALHQTLQVTTQAEALRQASERSSLADESTRIRAERSDLQSRQARLQGERDQLAAQLAETQAAREELAARLAAAEAIRQESSARQNALSETMNRLAANEAELAVLRSSVAAHEETKAHVAELDRANKQLSGERDQLQAEVAARLKAVSDMQAELLKTGQELESRALENKELRESRDALAALHHSLGSDHADLAKRHDLHAAKLEQLEDERSSLLSANKELASARETLGRERDSLAARLSERISELESERESLERSVREKKSHLDQELRDLRSELTRAKDVAVALEATSGQRLEDLAKLGALIVRRTTELEEAERLATVTGENSFRIRRVEVLGSQELPPHRHLDIELLGVSIAARDFEKLSVRLVEHRGRAGLALLQPAGRQETPLRGWKESGKEGGRPYMLIVPADSSSQTFLRSSCGSDHYFIRFLASALEQALLKSCNANSPGSSDAVRAGKWLPVARLLAAELDKLPERLHFDSATMKMVADATPGRWAFEFTNVSFAGRSLRLLAGELRTCPDSRKGEIVLRLTEASSAPLLTWPYTGDLDPAEDAVVRCEASAWSLSDSGKEPALQAADQDFLRAVAAEFPALAGKLGPEQGIDATVKKQLLRLARCVASSNRFVWSR